MHDPNEPLWIASITFPAPGQQCLIPCLLVGTDHQVILGQFAGTAVRLASTFGDMRLAQEFGSASGLDALQAACRRTVLLHALGKLPFVADFQHVLPTTWVWPAATTIPELGQMIGARVPLALPVLPASRVTMSDGTGQAWVRPARWATTATQTTSGTALVQACIEACRNVTLAPEVTDLTVAELTGQVLVSVQSGSRPPVQLVISNVLPPPKVPVPLPETLRPAAIEPGLPIGEWLGGAPPLVRLWAAAWLLGRVCPQLSRWLAGPAQQMDSGSLLSASEDSPAPVPPIAIQRPVWPPDPTIPSGVRSWLRAVVAACRRMVEDPARAAELHADVLLDLPAALTSNRPELWPVRDLANIARQIVQGILDLYGLPELLDSGIQPDQTIEIAGRPLTVLTPVRDGATALVPAMSGLIIASARTVVSEPDQPGTGALYGDAGPAAIRANAHNEQLLAELADRIRRGDFSLPEPEFPGS